MKKNNKKNDKSELAELVKRFLKKKYQEFLEKLDEAARESPICPLLQKKN